jgi:hypothetical protein
VSERKGSQLVETLLGNRLSLIAECLLNKPFVHPKPYFYPLCNRASLSLKRADDAIFVTVPHAATSQGYMLAKREVVLVN